MIFYYKTLTKKGLSVSVAFKILSTYKAIVIIEFILYELTKGYFRKTRLYLRK